MLIRLFSVCLLFAVKKKLQKLVKNNPVSAKRQCTISINATLFEISAQTVCCTEVCRITHFGAQLMFSLCKFICHQVNAQFTNFVFIKTRWWVGRGQWKTLFDFWVDLVQFQSPRQSDSCQFFFQHFSAEWHHACDKKVESDMGESDCGLLCGENSSHPPVFQHNVFRTSNINAAKLIRFYQNPICHKNFAKVTRD